MSRRSTLPRDPAPQGLAPGQAADRLRVEGPNELPQRGVRTFWRIVIDVIREPMFGLLLAAGAIYLLLGDLGEALLLLVFASISVGIAIIQENRSERVLEALRDLTSPRALVIRGGQRLRIPGREVVRGDLIVLGEGDRVAADAVVLACDDLMVDESLLTGESMAVRKTPAPLAQDDDAMRELMPGGDDLPGVFAGTLVVRGQGVARVQSTGARSRIGRIGQSLEEIVSATPRLTQETRSIVRTVAWLGLVCSVVAIVLFGWLRGSWLDAVLAGIALGMSMLPEEFPLVLTVFMVMGAWRLSKARVLTRRAAAIETLGAATVLCTDKTGTLTENRMTIVELRTLQARLRLDEDEPSAWSPSMARLLAAGTLASAPEPFDPMEKAFHALQARNGGTSQSLQLVRTYPLRPELLAVTQAWQTPNDDGWQVAAKGSPEAIATLCRLDAEQLAAVRRQADEMAAGGLRVLGVAEARCEEPALPETPHRFELDFLGLVGLEDPVRASVPMAVRECREAGIRVIMVTGDYPQTARAIAERAGIENGVVLGGAEIQAMDEAELAELREAVRRASVFARIMPEQKLRLVQALKAAGEVVAMTGDGVNDAPALKAADIGVAMGGRGTDVAREASSLVLLDDDFGSIVHTVRLGRRIYDNLRKAMSYILAIHVSIAGMALLPLLTGLPIVLWPVHIALLEMVIDPVCSIVFEAEEEEADVMRRPPRKPDSRILSGNVIAWSLLQGLLAFAIVAGIYLGAVRAGGSDAEVRAVTFVGLMMANFALVLVNRSYGVHPIRQLTRPNRALVWVVAVAGSLIAMALLWPPATTLFRFGAFHWHDLAIAALAALGLAVVLDVLKATWRQRLAA